ncbi:MAG TPA: tRNA (adenosine(37)-N6)-threonylcarbamoyltransferase complex dimerization subunit type 1 TsaB [Candidatus Saccharimonadales bacterium]|nr:tRNA (adenosine(37)-N6)-threonylcarbamoyltransferase complex dimerization subunit type 1 TsaB [Candidatus Saccharimonadales bacterium]
MTAVLAIDTASRSRIVVVRAGRDGTVLRAEVMRGASVGTSLPGLLQRMLSEDVEAVVVVVGPGTYTGVRAGMAGALGVAQARGLPLHGIGSLEVVACAPLTSSYGASWVAADAGRGALYVARTPAAATPRRVLLGEFDSGGAVVFSTDTLTLQPLVVIDPAAALSAAVPLALSRPPLDPDGLTALYVD